MHVISLECFQCGDISATVLCNGFWPLEFNQLKRFYFYGFGCITFTLPNINLVFNCNNPVKKVSDLLKCTEDKSCFKHKDAHDLS